MKNRGYLSVLCATSLLVFMQACTLHTVDQSPKPPIITPEHYAMSGSVDTPDRWWQSFNDDDLNQIIDIALSDNLDLRMGWARMEQANAIARQTGAAGKPQLSYNAGTQRNRSHLPTGRDESAQFSQSLAASYEVDLWNRIASSRQAAELDWQATRDDVETIAISLSANLCDLWFTAIEKRARLDLINRQLEVSQTFLDLTESRFGQGMTSAVDVYQQRSQLASIRSLIPTVESQLTLSQHQLAVLMGRAPKYELPEQPNILPQLSQLPETGVPADLLKRRPDIRSAQKRLVAADHRIAAAVADKYPILSLTGRTGLGGDQLDQLFSNWIWTIAANTAVPILDGDRRSAEVDRTRAVVKEKLLAYGNTVLTAIKEVEDSLTQEQKQKEYLERLQKQLEIAKQTLSETRSRYVGGLGNYLPVLTALQAVQQVERSELEAQRNLINFRIQLHRALGGVWPSELQDESYNH
jgi:NodT family efflux transporter outer membrane factor (OMF) lipoprotein